jgi:hypothetical protein
LAATWTGHCSTLGFLHVLGSYNSQKLHCLFERVTILKVEKTGQGFTKVKSGLKA